MKYKFLNPENHGQITLLSLNRPDSLNALNSDFFTEINLFLDQLNTERHRVLIISGKGKAFVAGADIAEMAKKSPRQALQFAETGQETFLRLEKLPVPVIAAINGYALGGGLELALACDFRIASNNAVFGQPEVSLGVIPGFAATQRLPRLIGLSDALFLLLSGEKITAQQALRIRLVQQVVETDKLLPTVLEIAQGICQKAPKAVRKVKEVVRKGLEMSFEQGCQLEAKEFAALFENEGSEGMKAFLEKRKPNWKA